MEDLGSAPMRTIAAALRRERLRTGLSLSEVARRASLAKSTLSQLEAGSGNPSIETLWAVGTALGVPFARLVDPTHTAVRVVRAGEGPTIASERADYIATLLASCPPGARRDLYLVTAQPGKPRESDPHLPGVLEHVVLVSGRALVGVTREPVELGPGDYTTYPGDVPHLFRALEQGTMAAFITEHV